MEKVLFLKSRPMENLTYVKMGPARISKDDDRFNFILQQ